MSLVTYSVPLKTLTHGESVSTWRHSVMYGNVLLVFIVLSLIFVKHNPRCHFLSSCHLFQSPSPSDFHCPAVVFVLFFHHLSFWMLHTHVTPSITSEASSPAAFTTHSRTNDEWGIREFSRHSASTAGQTESSRNQRCTENKICSLRVHFDKKT